MSIEIINVSKDFGSFKALNNINLKINKGELVALLGPSGSGKTTLLRIIAGLENSDYGNIVFDGEDTTSKTTKERNVGFVFQHYALFKHMTVFENIAFGLKVRPRKIRPQKEEINNKVKELLALVKMEGMAQRYPNQLSGGQRQRIALARALAVQPKVLLLDEPFGALDAKVRKELRRWLRKLHDEYSITSIFVTHDQEEALDVADRIVVLNEGRIEQIGTPEEVYDNPKNAFVYNFLGNVNLFHGRVNDGRIDLITDSKSTYHNEDYGQVAVSYARPHNTEILLDDSVPGTIKCKVFFVRTVGPSVNVELVKLEGEGYIEVELNKETYNTLNIKTGDEVFVRPRDVKVFLPDYVI